LVEAILTRGAVTAASATGAWGIGALTPGTRRRSATMGLTALVGTQLDQTLAARRHSPLVLATTAGSAAALITIVQTPGVSHFFGCTPLGPLAWAGVLTTTGVATAASVVIPDRISSQRDRKEIIG
jgi:cation-transporting ATPase I